MKLHHVRQFAVMFVHTTAPVVLVAVGLRVVHVLPFVLLDVVMLVAAVVAIQPALRLVKKHALLNASPIAYPAAVVVPICAILASVNVLEPALLNVNKVVHCVLICVVCGVIQIAIVTVSVIVIIAASSVVLVNVLLGCDRILPLISRRQVIARNLVHPAGHLPIEPVNVDRLSR